MPGVKKQRDPHHAQRAPLGDSTAPRVGFAEAGGKCVVDAKVFLKAGIGVDEKVGKTSGGSDAV